MARKHPGMYRVRARRHEAAAKKASGYKREGHEEIAGGYHKLAAHSEYGERRHSRRGRKHGKKRHHGKHGKR
jgi:hypothetical protein